ncbi:MAG: hypothetical protein ACI81R_000141 [Bradymonadia bacterium]|jgi:hypothetical protein
MIMPSRRRATLTLLSAARSAAAGLVVLLGGSALAHAQAPAVSAAHAGVLGSTAPLVLPYQGELIDGANASISGVFRLTFRLFRQEADTVASWEETHWIGVEEGGYTLELGHQTAVPADWIDQAMFIGIEMGAAGEFVRHALTLEAVPPAQSREEVLAGLDASFADLADRALFAIEADIAEDCERVGGLSLEELDRYEEVLDAIASLEERVDAATGATLGSRTTTLERVGGAGGNPYSRACPPGHLVTGFRGTAGALIDSVELICAPLQ